MKPRVVLLGAGHAHAGVLRAQALRRVMDADLTVISVSKLAPYSGMLPGWMAGHYSWEDICIDFARLSRAAGARFIEARITGIDLVTRQVQLQDGQRIDYDFLSLNVGSTHAPPVAGDASRVLPLRPLGTLLGRVQHFIAWSSASDAPLSIAVVGAGGAGFEMALAINYRLRQVYPQRGIQVTLLSDVDHALTGRAASAQRLAAQALKRHGVSLRTMTTVQSIEGSTLNATQQGQALKLPADLIIWAAGAQAKPWMQASGLACDARGFVQADATLRSASHANVFAAGDCASLPTPLPKAGVYPVRQGPLLAANLAAVIGGAALQRYEAQARALGIFATGPKHAIASYGPFSVAGDWVWRWKDRIDRAFLARHAL